jgi:hypothetical protein
MVENAFGKPLQTPDTKTFCLFDLTHQDDRAFDRFFNFLTAGPDPNPL